MTLSQQERAKEFVVGVKGVLASLDLDTPISSYIRSVSTEIRGLIRDSGLSDSGELEKEYMSFRQKLFSAVRGGEIQSFSDVSSFLVAFGTSQISESLKNEHVNVVTIDEEFWKNSSVERPKEGVIFRGGTARKLLREYLGLAAHDADKDTDIDIFTGPDENIDQLRNYYMCDAEGITQLPDIGENSLIEQCKNVDIAMNQLLVSRSKIYYTQKSESALRTGISEIVQEPSNLFGVKQYTDESGRVIFTNQKLYRVISMLVRGKLNAIKVRHDNIAYENSHALGGMEKYLVIIIKKIILQAGDDRASLELMMYRYADLLLQMGYISRHEDIFLYLGNTHEQGVVKVYDSYLEKDFHDKGKRDMLWRLDKLTRLFVRQIIPEVLDGFTFDPKNTIVELGVDNSQLKAFTKNFESNWDMFTRRIQSQDLEK